MHKYYNDNWPREKYTKIAPEYYLIPHLGQRKLFIAELRFITKYRNSADVIIYAGAAPGPHIAQLAIMFPDKMFYLYDPREFSPVLAKHKNIITHQEYFTDEIVREFKYDKLLFISDIRTGHENDTNAIFEKEVDENLKQQRRWCELMGDSLKMASLKFRLPFIQPGCDDKEYEYFSGRIVLQSWHGRDSAESRLWTNAQQTKIYSCKDYEEKMFYYNKNLRLGSYDIGQSANCMDRCNDCAIEWYTWKKYYESKGQKINIDVINKLPQSLCIGTHGMMRDLNVNDRVEALREQTIIFYDKYHINEKNRMLYNKSTKRISN